MTPTPAIGSGPDREHHVDFQDGGEFAIQPAAEGTIVILSEGWRHGHSTACVLIPRDDLMAVRDAITVYLEGQP